MALAIVVVAETGRLPVDNPSTHLELTMIHEAMVLESSGRDLGWLELRLLAAAGRPARAGRQPAVPWGVAWTAHPGACSSASSRLVLKLAVLAGLLAAGEVFLAKVRLFRVPELLAGSFVLAFLAVTASYLVP